MNYNFFLFPLAAFFSSLIILPFLRKAAIRIQLVDKPNSRKVHHQSVPLVGGIGVVLSTTVALLPLMVLKTDILPLASLVFGSLVFLVMGVLDDKMDIKASLKLAVQLLVAHYIYASGIRLESFYGVFGIYEIPAMVQYMLTIVIITGVVNAFNLMDGIDGLASGLAIVSMLVFAVLAFVTSNTFLGILFLTMSGSLAGFLRFNFSNTKKIFMGDAGSLVLGFILVVSAIVLLQSAGNTGAIKFVMPGVMGVLLLPVIDSLRVYRRRMKSGKSPFRPDKTHLHHLVLQLGMKHKRATFFIVSLALGIIVLSFITSFALGITLTLAFSLLIYFAVAQLLHLNSEIIRWRTKIIEMEKGHYDK